MMNTRTKNGNDSKEKLTKNQVGKCINEKLEQINY